ncbi:sugar phosphate isomerase/epimerase [Halanaerobium congolense]|uniref:Sugar phosphate isomerase/epimerase n=1 Tax=Halanaerobium congolense TaxID=54121 RepID=A0A318E8B1_9FIRM|nr:sugar phosphate isomerase/epimerase family protein [Halanaerobium congolense]PXV62571.1 sugar phosphate isomerase/epimerase [Halanaerobium congolense]
MDSIPISVNNWIFGNTDLESVFKRAADIDFDGIELVGEPSIYDIDQINKLKDKYNIRVPSICGMHPGPEEDDLRALSHYKAQEREKAVEYVKKCVDLAAGVGARSVLIVPSLVGQPQFFSSKEEDINHAISSIKKAAKYAERNEIILTIEPINRYEVGLINSIEDAVNMVKKINNDFVKTMGDTFHMQIEEGEGISNAIRRAGSYLQHLHVADNTRQAPGMGTMPWREIIRALYDINYPGSISLEPLPKGKAPYDARNGNIPAEQLDNELKFGYEYLKKEMKIIKNHLS